MKHGAGLYRFAWIQQTAEWKPGPSSIILPTHLQSKQAQSNTNTCSTHYLCKIGVLVSTFHHTWNKYKLSCFHLCVRRLSEGVRRRGHGVGMAAVFGTAEPPEHVETERDTRWVSWWHARGGMYLSALNLSGGNHPWNVFVSQLKVSGVSWQSVWERGTLEIHTCPAA